MPLGSEDLQLQVLPLRPGTNEIEFSCKHAALAALAALAAISSHSSKNWTNPHAIIACSSTLYQKFEVDSIR